MLSLSRWGWRDQGGNSTLKMKSITKVSSISDDIVVNSEERSWLHGCQTWYYCTRFCTFDVIRVVLVRFSQNLVLFFNLILLALNIKFWDKINKLISQKLCLSKFFINFYKKYEYLDWRLFDTGPICVMCSYVCVMCSAVSCFFFQSSRFLTYLFQITHGGLS